jgi:hypothetical protein
MLKDKEDALILSILSTTNMLEQQFNYAVDMLLIIGQTVSGLSEEDLT